MLFSTTHQQHHQQHNICGQSRNSSSITQHNSFSLHINVDSIQVWTLLLVQSLDPLPMHGRDLGIHPEDFVETPDVEQEAKQEILENKDVRITGSCGATSIVLPS